MDGSFSEGTKFVYEGAYVHDSAWPSFDEEEARRFRGGGEKAGERYIGKVRPGFKVCRSQAVPLYSSKFSRRDFTLWQHIALLS